MYFFFLYFVKYHQIAPDNTAKRTDEFLKAVDLFFFLHIPLQAK